MSETLKVRDNQYRVRIAIKDDMLTFMFIVAHMENTKNALNYYTFPLNSSTLNK